MDKLVPTVAERFGNVFRWAGFGIAAMIGAGGAYDILWVTHRPGVLAGLALGYSATVIAVLVIFTAIDYLLTGRGWRL